jgi:hypothetical protein
VADVLFGIAYLAVGWLVLSLLLELCLLPFRIVWWRRGEGFWDDEPFLGFVDLGRRRSSLRTP